MSQTSRREPKVAWDKTRTRELFRRYKEDGDDSAREKLVMNHMGLVRFLAAKFQNRGEPLDDLIQVGTIGLIKAIDRFEIDRGLEFTTYATPTILGEIKRHFRDKGWSVRVPRRLQELSSKVSDASDALVQTYQRLPTVDEIAEYLGVSPDEVLEAMESSEAYTSVPLEAGSDDEDSFAVIDRLGQSDADLDLTDARILVERALEGFTPKERQIVTMRFIDGRTQSEIAEELGVNQVQVSRMLKRTLKRMQDKLSGDALPYDA